MHRTRRTFLGQAAAACVAGCAVWPVRSSGSVNATIASIQTFPIVYPTVGRFKFFEGPRGQPSGRPSVLVKITADDGTVGWGQSVPTPRWSYETLETVDSTIRRYLTPELIGRDPCDLEGMR